MVPQINPQIPEAHSPLGVESNINTLEYHYFVLCDSVSILKNLPIFFH